MGAYPRPDARHKPPSRTTGRGDHTSSRCEEHLDILHVPWLFLLEIPDSVGLRTPLLRNGQRDSGPDVLEPVDGASGHRLDMSVAEKYVSCAGMPIARMCTAARPCAIAGRGR